MRRQEEKILIIIEVISLVCIVLTTILLQVADNKIKNYNDEIIMTEIKLSDYIQIGTYHEGRIHFWELSGLLGQLGASLKKEMVIEEDSIIEPEKIDEKSRRLMNRYKTNEIDAHTYITEMGNLSREKKQYYASRVEQTRNTIENMLKNPPKFFLIDIFIFRSICFGVQLWGTFIAMILFAQILINVNKRSSG